MPPSTTGSSISDRARNGNGAAADAQEGMFDKQIDDASLEELIDQREALAEKARTANSKLKDKAVLVKARLAEFELAVGEVARVGKYRIENKRRAGGHREFDVAPSEQLSISLIDTGE